MKAQKITSNYKLNLLICALLIASGCNETDSNLQDSTNQNGSASLSKQEKHLKIVGDDFRLQDIPSNSFSELSLNRDVVVLEDTTTSRAVIADTGPIGEYLRQNYSVGNLNPLSVYDGRVLQNFTKGYDCLDGESGRSLEPRECEAIHDLARCYAWWTPVKPAVSGDKGTNEPDNEIYWKIPASYKFRIKRFNFSKNSFTFSDKDIDLVYNWNEMIVECNGISEESLTVANLKTAFGSSLVLKIYQ